jgi:hypothetical protein
MEQAFEDRNWTAVAAMSRLRLQFHGLLKDHMVLEREVLDPDELVKHLARGDEELATMLHKIVGRSEGFTKH